jgi:hypothetical protein
MSGLACPYCYGRIEVRGLWFRCTGRGSPGKERCKPVHDADRVREIGIDELVLPSFAPKKAGLRAPVDAVCPRCGAPSAVKVCPHCHSKLPVGFGEAASPLIAMVGAKGTGKSVYLKVLAHELRHGMSSRFDADIRLHGDGQFSADGAGRDFLDPAGKLFPDRQLYAQTSQSTNGRREPILFAWRQRRRFPGLSQFETTYLSFFDTAGEDLGNQDDVDNLRYLGAAEALILLLDPFMIPQARDSLRLPAAAVQSAAATIDVVARVTESLRISHRLGSRRNIAIPVAVAFVKIDAFFGLLGSDHPLVRRPQPGPFYDEGAGRETHEFVRAQLHGWRADDIDAHLTLNYRNFRYFAVSALGAEPDYDRGVVDERGVHPFRVDEPLLWLLSRFGVVPSGSGAAG